MHRAVGVVSALAMAVSACGGGDDVSDLADAIQEAPDEAADQETGTAPSAIDSENSVDAGGQTAPTAEVPVVRFAAHGPDADNTIGPSCATAIDARGGDVFRFTPPVGWVWWGTSGGTGYDQVEVKDATEVSLIVTESAYDYDTAALRDWQLLGPAGADIEIDGVSVPIMEISLEGDSGYAIVDFDYMSPVPGLGAGASLGTVALTSAEPGRPTLDEAVQLLSTVRIERCAAVAEAMIGGPAAGVHLVPRFEPDPLGKGYPDQPQPAYDPTVGTLESYTPEQVAYLMSVEEDVAMCVAERAIEWGAGNPIAYLYMFAPSGTNTADLEAILAQC